ncbi:MAG: retroviral-like aspartic protease family protein [Candidatus Rokubacteria bacterium]|nr:retroviral-like aspartic protease family protein [Candidatus Rokubacteria bacterium]
MSRTLIAALSLVLATAAPAPAQLYTWTDHNGVVHYTADPSAIPQQFQPGENRPTPTPAVPVPVAADPWSNWGKPVVAAPTAGAVVEFSPGDPIVVNARLNGVPVALLLDTGADRTLVSPSAVARAGYGGLIVPGGAGIRIVGVTGTAMAAQVTVPVLDVAGAQIGPLALIVHDAGLGALDGLLGRDVLDAFTVTIDSAAGRATLTPR